MTASIQYLPAAIEKTNAHHRGSDEWGSGHFMAPRGTRDHHGIDFLVSESSIVYSMVTGTVTKLGTCYRGAQYRYVQVDDDNGNHVRMFYIMPSVLVGDLVKMGQNIGVAQNLADRYPADFSHSKSMPNHVHLEVVKKGTLFSGKEFIDPDLYIFA